MSWLLLLMGIVVEVAGTTCMKLSYGFTHLWPSILLFIFYSLSFSMVTVALKSIDLSAAYAVWSGVGTALTAAIGAVWFKEPMGVVKIISLFLIVLGVAGLRWGQPAG